MRLSTNGMNHAFAFPAEAGTPFTDPRKMEDWIDLVTAKKQTVSPLHGYYTRRHASCTDGRTKPTANVAFVSTVGT